MTALELADTLDRLGAEATEAPWNADGCCVIAPSSPTGRMRPTLVCPAHSGPNAQQRANAAMIAALRNALPSLTAALLVCAAAEAFMDEYDNATEGESSSEMRAALTAYRLASARGPAGDEKAKEASDGN